MLIFHIIRQCSGHLVKFDIFIGVSGGALRLSDCDDVPTEVEAGSQCGRRRAIVTRRLCLLLVVPPCLFQVAATSEVESYWRKHSTLACITSGVRLGVPEYCSSFLVLHDFRRL